MRAGTPGCRERILTVASTSPEGLGPIQWSRSPRRPGEASYDSFPTTTRFASGWIWRT